MLKPFFLLRKPVNFLLFCFSICCLMIGLAITVQKQFAEKVDSEIAASPSPSRASETPHTLVGSYYTLETCINAKLLLNNKGPTQLEVRPTLFSANGQELQIAPVYVEPQSARYIDLQEWAAIGGSDFQSGNIKLFHYGKDLVLGAQIYLTDEARSLTFEEKLAEMGKFNSQRLETVWSMPPIARMYEW